MCSKARFIANVCQRIIKVKGVSPRVQKIQDTAFYTAPEICDLLWNDLFQVVVDDYKDDGAVCKIYNESYRAYMNLNKSK